MRLYIVRHGKAQTFDAPTPSAMPAHCVLPIAALTPEADLPELTDFGLALTPRGTAQSEYLAAALRGRERRLHTILASPYRRATQTATIIRDALDGRGGGGGTELRTEVALVPERGVTAAVNLIRANDHDRALMLVGHNPQLGELLALLTVGLSPDQLMLRTGELIALEIKPTNLVGTARLVGRVRLGDAKAESARPSDETIAGLCFAPAKAPTTETLLRS